MIESEGAIRHLPFFEALSKTTDDDPCWRQVSAGLVVLRLLDAWVEDGASVVANDAWGLTAVVEAVETIDQRMPVRRVLLGVVDAMQSSGSVDLHVVTPRLMAYAQTLEYDAQWALAADVYQTINAHGHPAEDGDLVVPATIQLGTCLKNLGDLRAASNAYATASEIARANGDLIGVLRSRIAEATVAISRGNMPEAEALLDDTIAQATENDFTELQRRALQERAMVAGIRGQYDRVVQFGYRALDLSTNQRDRDRILSDIATGFLDLGLIEVARDAYLVLIATAQDQYVRWSAGLNLIEVASLQGMEPMFDRYRRDFENVELPPYLQVRYYLNIGNGYRGFGRPTEAIHYLERAMELAASSELNQLLFEAEESLAEAKLAVKRQPRAPAAELSPEIMEVADAIHRLREVAV